MSHEKTDQSIYLSDEEKTKKPLLNSTNGGNTNSNENSPKSNYDEANETSVMIKGEAPLVKDKFFAIYVIFILFGIANLLPWNIFITAEDYFVNYKLNTNTSRNATYTTDFIFYIGTVGQVTNVLMNIFNILVPLGGNPKNRIPYTLILSSMVILFHIALAIIDSQTWPGTFFILCVVSVFVMYVATGIMNSCIWYVASIFPMEYVNAIILGNNFAGIFTSVMNIVSKLASSSNFRMAAIYYFLSAFVVLMFALIGYFLMHRMSYYRYWNEIDKENKRRALLENNNRVAKVPYLKILKKIWPLLFCIWLNFLSSLSIFPVFQLGIQPVCTDNSFIIPKNWFQDIVTFLTFNIFVTIGNMIPKLIKKPGPRWIPLAVIIRAVVVFVFFALCNYKPNERKNIPVLITNDYAYWIGAMLSPLFFGYFTSLLMMYTPKQVDPEHAGSAAMIAALVLVIGVVSGLQFTKILDLIVLL